MASPLPPAITPAVINIFVEIHDYITIKYDLQADKQTPSIVKFEEEKARHRQLLKNVIYDDYVVYWGKIALNHYLQRGESSPSYDAAELWHTVYHSPLENAQQSNDLAKFINHSQFPEVIELGKLNGDIPCRLEPRQGLLKEPGRGPFGDLSYAEVASQAIIYVKGHPCEGDGKPILITPADDTVLRRIREIGNILVKPHWEDWQMTGHVLVMDLDRDRHPWLILAKTWETDEEEPQTYTAPDEVLETDTSSAGSLGILPGHGERTTVARLVTCGDYCFGKPSEHPLLLQFGAGFEFCLERPGGEVTEAEECSRQGSRLAKIRSWFQRPDGEEVCFIDEKEGIEYMTRNPDTGTYSYPNPKFQAF